MVKKTAREMARWAAKEMEKGVGKAHSGARGRG
jgi:hypothetical protein